MSFYGDITNTSRTHFQFDRIYANRAEMERYKETDGIYAGRFVLIEYDNEMHMDSFLRVRKDGDKFYTTFSDNTAQEVLLTRGNIKRDTIVYESAYETLPANGYYAKNCTFYKCTSSYIENSEEPATFDDIVGEGEENPHITNYSIDSRMYGRGYDSTVWQKVYDGGVERYMMVAELNTVLPTFDLQPDAPTQTPIVPHFDIQGSDIYYKLHHQPAWGFRVKSAKPETGPEFRHNGNIIEDSEILYTSNSESNYPSDETTEWVRTEYNPDTGHLTTLYWHSGNSENGFAAGEWKNYPPEDKLPAAIYYNKAGFDPEIITKSSLDDCITIEGSGISGRQYSSHDSVGTETSYPDIQEISMMLPSIGNSISEMWDLVYGNQSMSTEQTEDGKSKRNLDVDWNSTKGLRMVSNKESGFDYNTEQVSTIAGAINSVHDLMGMIIIAPEEPMSEEFAKGAEDNKIYYSNGEYYHRVNRYEYDTKNAISAIDGDRTLTGDEIKEISYKTLGDKSYFNSFPPEDDEFYYGTPGQVYSLEEEEYPTYNRVYYATIDKTPFFTQITPIQFDRSIHYRFIPGEIVEGVQLGYYVNSDTLPVDGVNYYEITKDEIIAVNNNKIPYIPNKYYIYDGGKPIEDLEDGAIDLSKITLSTDGYVEGCPYYTASIKDGDLLLELVDVFGVTDKHYYQDLTNNRYYRCAQDYVPNDTEVLAKPTRYKFVTIEDQVPVDYFYIPNKYYIFIEDNKEYCIYGEEDWDNTLAFYLRTLDSNIRIVNLIAEKYYVANTYYYQLANKKMTIDRNKTVSDNTIYYLRDKVLYVSEDANDVMNIGMEWNENVTTIPKGITITTREAIPTMQRLEGFARELNTIHGLILEINRLLLTNDIHTRDAYTVQGAINIINDIIDKFEIIAPKQFVIVDDYGRIHSAPYSEDDWINIEIDSNVLEPQISITHKFNPVDDTTSISSQDEDESDGNIELYTPIVDDKGHIIGKNIETVELPHNFKSVTVAGTKLIADSHIANFNILSDNSWISLDVDANTDTLTINHIGPASDGTTSYNTNDTPIFGESFNVPTITYDSKGHISNISNHTVTLPTLSISSDTNGGNVLIGASINMSGVITLTTSKVGSLMLSEYDSTDTSVGNIESTDNISEALRKLENRIAALEKA